MTTIKELLFLPPGAKRQALFLAYRHGQILAANVTACHLYGYTEEELLQLNSRELVFRDPQFENLLYRIQNSDVAYGRINARKNGGASFAALIESKRIGKEISVPVYLIKVTPVDELARRLGTEEDDIQVQTGRWEVRFSEGKIQLDEVLAGLKGASAPLYLSLKDGEKLLVDKSVRSRIRKLAQESAVYGIPWTEEFQLTIRKGEKHWVRCDCMPVFQSGSCIGLKGTLQVIDVFKKNDKYFEDQNTQLRILFENMDHLVTIRDKQFRLLYCNDNVVRLFGFEREEFAKMQIKDLVYSEDQERTQSALREVRKLGMQKDFHNRVITKSGEVRELSWDFIWFAEGEKLYAVGKDITPLKKAKRESEGIVLRTEEEEKHALFNELHENICQTFAAAKIYLSTFLNQGGSENLEKANQLMTAGIESTRALAAVHLFPDLKLQTFVEALRIYFIELNKAGGTLFSLDSRSFRGRDLPIRVKSMLYRIVQEITTKIIQHANAKKASLKLILKSSNLKLELKHDGKWEDQACPPDGTAFQHLQTRLDQLGGSLVIIPEPKRGCLIVVELDLMKFDGFRFPGGQSVAQG